MPLTTISYSVHKFYTVNDVDNLDDADKMFLRIYKANYNSEIATLESQIISRVVTVDGVDVSTAVSLDDGITWVGEAMNRSIVGT